MARFTEKRLGYMLDHFNDENAMDSREAYLDYLISGIPSQSWGDILEDIDAQVRNQDLLISDSYEAAEEKRKQEYGYHESRVVKANTSKSERYHSLETYYTKEEFEL